MVDVTKSLGKQFNLSSGVLVLIIGSLIEATTKQHAPHLRRWFSFYREIGLDLLNAETTSGAEFQNQNISVNLVVSILQSTQLVQVSHLFSQQLMDLCMVKNSYEEASSKGQHSHIAVLHMMSRYTKYVKDFLFSVKRYQN